MAFGGRNLSTTLISGGMLSDMMHVGCTLLEKRKSVIDAMNVFPVPDGDTGTNMCMTMQGAKRELDNSHAQSAAEVAQAVSLGALKGARGNSGVILSQIFRGFSRAVAEKEELDAKDFALAITMGTEAAYKAVMKPREGTMLTVSRMIGEAVTKAAEEGANVYRLIDIAIESGEEALKKTPELLPVLKEAGVVDAGGMGLLTIFKGFKMALDGEEAEDSELYALPNDSDTPTLSSFDDDLSDEDIALSDLEDIKFGYCSEFFIVHLNESFNEAELDKLREKFVRIGDSAIVVHEGDIVKVHVHSNCPGKILQLALRFGELEDIKIDNMREQNRRASEKRKKEEKESAIVAVSSGAGIEEVFKQLGVSVTITGGQTMNPSVDTIARAIKKANARNVYVLPNNSNIIFAANQAAELAKCNVHVIPTKSMVQGISAAIAFIDSEDAQENIDEMVSAVKNVVSGSVTYAVRDTHFNDIEIKEGDIIGLLNGEITDVGSTPDEVALKLIERMVAMKDEDAVITAFRGEDTPEETASELMEKIEEKYPDAEVMLQYGGQPLYYYYFSVE